MSWSTRARSALAHVPGEAAASPSPFASIVAVASSAPSLVETHDDRLAALVLEEVANGKAHRALLPEPAEVRWKSAKSVMVMGSRQARARPLPTNAVMEVATPVIVRTPLLSSSM